MRFVHLPVAVLTIGLGLGLLQPVSGQAPDTLNALRLLRQSGPYDLRQKQTFPAFTYQAATAAPLTQLRQRFHLDSVAGSGSDVARAIRLMAWLHIQVPHGDERNHAELNAQNIILKYQTQHLEQGCYPIAIALNEVFLAMGFKSRVVICFSERLAASEGGHVITSVYLPSLKKWVWMDGQNNAYVQDERGRLLSIPEVRQRLVAGQPLVLNATANYHQEPIDKTEYLDHFMGLHLFRMLCPLRSEYNSETPRPGHDKTYVELLPLHSAEPMPDDYETHQAKGYRVVNYRTHNALLFWQKPA